MRTLTNQQLHLTSYRSRKNKLKANGREGVALGQIHPEQRINKKQKSKDTKSWSLRPAGTCGGTCL